MNHEIIFTKATGAGNDFVIVENMRQTLNTDRERLAQSLCSRHFGVGADGLLLIEPSDIADFAMLYYNADGSYGGMCGNGGRCLAKYAYLQKIAGPQMRFEALGYVYEADVMGVQVKMRMKDPSAIRNDIPIASGGESFTGHFVNTGSPHVVIFINEIDKLPVKDLGRQIREHGAFAPDGTNVNFVRLGEGNNIYLRTYERGVENETLACGTGSVASAILSSIVHNRKSPMSVHVRSGEELLVSFEKNQSEISNVYLQGNAAMLFSGRLLYDDISGKILAMNEIPSTKFSIQRT